MHFRPPDTKQMDATKQLYNPSLAQYISEAGMALT